MPRRHIAIRAGDEQDPQFCFGNTNVALTGAGAKQNIVTDPAISSRDGQALTSVLSGRAGSDFMSSAWK